MRPDPATCRDPDILAAEVRRLREAIRRLAEQDATLSVCEGAVTVTMDATLTPEEREAIHHVVGDVADITGPVEDTLRKLLERHCPVQENAAKQDSIPARESTAAECTVPPEWTSRPYYVDPPSGWAYGFPRLYDPASDGDMVEWMIRNGYPEELARQGLPCTFTAATE